MEPADLVKFSTPLADGERPGLFERVEACAGVLLWGISSCSTIAGCLWLMAAAESKPEIVKDYWLFVGVALLMVLATVVSGWFIVRGFVGARSPLILHIVDRQPRLDLNGMSAVVPWWAWHFLSMTVAGDLFWQEARERFPGLPHGITENVIRFVLNFSSSAAANL